MGVAARPEGAMTRMGRAAATMALLTMAAALPPMGSGERHGRPPAKPKRPRRTTRRERMAKSSRARNRKRR